MLLGKSLSLYDLGFFSSAVVAMLQYISTGLHKPMIFVCSIAKISNICDFCKDIHLVMVVSTNSHGIVFNSYSEHFHCPALQ